MANQDIQLLPETRKKIDVVAPGGNRILIGGVLFLAIVLAGGFYFTYKAGQLEDQVTSLNADLATLESKRDKSFEDNIRIVKQQLELVSGYINKHLYWTRVLKKIETLLQQNVQLTRMDFQHGVEESTVSVSGKVINYSTLARQIAALLSDDKVKDVDLQGAESKSTGLIEFNMKIRLKPSALYNEP